MVIDCIERWQRRIFQEHGTHFIHASDEWYLLAERELPEAERYDGYPQLENGVGMLRLLREETQEALRNLKDDGAQEELSIATGLLAGPCIEELCRKIQKKFPGRKIHVFQVKNHFFGERITVSGLITGQDLKEQLKGKELGSRLLLPCNMLREGENVFLDDVSVGELEKALQTKIHIVKSSGYDFVSAVIQNIMRGGKA